MEKADFVRLVKQMRDAQKAFFAARDPNKLDRSRQLERRVDRVIDQETTLQRALFGEDAAESPRPFDDREILHRPK